MRSPSSFVSARPFSSSGSSETVATTSIGLRAAYSKFSFRMSSPARDSYFSGRTLASGMPTFMWPTG
jgi:hypothetical protein